MLHVMHLIESLEFGGAEKVVVHLANKLSESYQVSICLTKRRGELVEQLKPEIQVHFLDSGEGNNFRLPKMIAALIERYRVDVLHSHDWGIYLEAAWAVGRTPRCQLVHTAHGHYTQYPAGIKSYFKKQLRHFLERKLSRYTYKIVPVSDAISRYIINKIGIAPSQIRRIHNGIKGLSRGKSKRYGRVTDNVEQKVRALSFVWVGRIAPVKNLSLLVHAFAILQRSHPETRLNIVGDGTEKGAIEDLVRRLKLEGKIKLSGFQKDIATCLSAADVFVLSSHFEGVSIAILEAMSLSMPVIATDVGGVAETVIDGQTGFLVTDDDAEQFARAMSKFAESPVFIKQLGARGAQHFRANFHEAVVLRQYQQLYAECTAETQD